MPTVSTEGLVLSYIIDMMEVQDVYTSDIPGAFQQTYYGKGDIYISMEGTMVTLLDYIDTSYYNYFIYIYPWENHL